ncbi:hypothetical protein [Paenibacillus sp. MBLB4367]|uniref:hypothetical protein n=1 Tax=Paenibacillus sp. MBLB4367 TaxID=3384767 RepID=UPI003907F63C
MKLGLENALDRLVKAETQDDAEQLRKTFEQGGYSLFSELLNELKSKLTMCDETLIGEMKHCVAKGKRIVSQPESISPAWEGIWNKLEKQIELKEFVLGQIPQEERAGEWQIVMDNPFTNDGIVCYPALSFIEAAYLYAYFRVDLKKTEYIRLQKVISLIVTQGS